jgi:hypothetical protein
MATVPCLYCSQMCNRAVLSTAFRLEGVSGLHRVLWLGHSRAPVKAAGRYVDVLSRRDSLNRGNGKPCLR